MIPVSTICAESAEAIRTSNNAASKWKKLRLKMIRNERCTADIIASEEAIVLDRKLKWPTTSVVGHRNARIAQCL
jgi:hypothetical protein